MLIGTFLYVYAAVYIRFPENILPLDSQDMQFTI